MNEASAKRTAAVWVAAVFLIGAALGCVGGYIYGSTHHSVVAANPPMTEEQRRAHKVEQLTQELSLTPDQQQQLNTILTQMHAQYKAVHEQSDAQIDQARQKGRNEVRAILTADQKPKFEDFLRRMDEERKRAEEERKRLGQPGGR